MKSKLETKRINEYKIKQLHIQSEKIIKYDSKRVFKYVFFIEKDWFKKIIIILVIILVWKNFKVKDTWNN